MATLTPHQILRERDREMIPKQLLRAMLALVLTCLAVVTAATVSDRPLVGVPPANAPVLQERQIVLYGDMTGAARVFGVDGTLIADLPPEKGGFIAGVASVLMRERGKIGAPADMPIRLVRFTDGRLGLRDDVTGWHAELIGFGADNFAAFARLLK